MDIFIENHIIFLSKELTLSRLVCSIAGMWSNTLIKYKEKYLCHFLFKYKYSYKIRTNRNIGNKG